MSANAPARASASRRPSSANSFKAVLVVVLVGGAGALTYALTRPARADTIRPRAMAAPVPPPTVVEMSDLGPLAALRAAGGGGAAFDEKALDHVLTAVVNGTLPRRSGAPLRVAAVAALDGSTAPGRLVETEGIVRSLDREKFSSSVNMRWDQLWAFALEDEGGARIVVVAPGASSELDGGRPAPVLRGVNGKPFEDGERVRVRGVVVQRRTGSVGSISLPAPTPVVVGREYRRVGTTKPVPKSIQDVPWSAVEDRSISQTYSPADDTYWAALAWERAVGHRAILEDLRSGAIAAKPWAGAQFFAWKQELESDRGTSAPDPRAFTRASRGRVFALEGILADALDEDWDFVPDNAYGVDRRTTYWILADHYPAALPLFSAFDNATFVGVPEPRSGNKQPRVRAFAAYLRNYSFTPRSSTNEITVPSFVLLHLETR